MEVPADINSKTVVKSNRIKINWKKNILSAYAFLNDYVLNEILAKFFKITRSSCKKYQGVIVLILGSNYSEHSMGQ